MRAILSVAFASLSIGWTIHALPPDPLFAAAPPVAVGKGSGEVVLADINRDGHLDLVTKHLLGRSVALLFGDGKGRFVRAAGSPIRFGYRPGAIAVGDVNHDTMLDLVVASRPSDKENVDILLGDGRGGFRPAAGSPVTVSAAMKFYKPTLRLVDVNEGGKVDIIASNGRRNTLEILFGDGRGGVSAGPIVRMEPGQDLYSFGVGDVDGDAHLDLVTASSPGPDGGPGRVVTKLGDGRGAFKDASGASVTVPPRARLVALGHVDGNRRFDVVLGHGGSSHLTILLNDGHGRFAPAHTPLNVGAEAFAVVVADVNRDTKADLVVATVEGDTPFGSRIVVLLGQRGGFAPAAGSPFGAGPGAYNLTVGDVNEDGRPDVAASSFEGDAVTVLLGR